MLREREVHGDRKGGATPVGEVAGVPLVLLHEEPPRQLVLPSVLDDAGAAVEVSPVMRTVTSGVRRRFLTQSEP